MPENQNRLGRIDEEYRREISQIISYDLKNPNVTGLISVTKVKVTNDLKYAKEIAPDFKILYVSVVFTSVCIARSVLLLAKNIIAYSRVFCKCLNGFLQGNVCKYGKESINSIGNSFGN